MQKNWVRKGLVIGILFLLLLSAFLVEGNVLVIEKMEPVRSSDQLNANDLHHSTSQWTIMYYMCGDSNMDDYTQPLLENLSKIGSTDDLNIVALTDNKKLGDSKLYYISESGEKIELNDIFGWPDEVDMSNTNTLELFCKQMMEAYPAEHYAFITYPSGGTGWQLYCIHDETTKNRGVTIPVFTASLKNIVNSVNHKIDVLFVSCAMGMIEIAHEFAPYVDYMVATQDCFPHEHVVKRFYESVWDLRNNTDMTPEEFASRAPARLQPESFYYQESYEGRLPLLNRILNMLPFPALHTVLHHPSSAVVNLSRVSDLSNAVNNLSSFLILHLHNDDVDEAIKKSRTNVEEYGKCYPKFWVFPRIKLRYCFEIFAYDCFVDLYDFVEILRDNIENPDLNYLCSLVMEKLNETIPAIKATPGHPSHGLSIYFPSSKIMYNKYILRGIIPSSYEELMFSHDTSWDDYLRGYLDIN